MCAIVLHAGDMGPMTIKRPQADENNWPIDEKAVTSAFEDCLALIRKENAEVAIFQLICTAQATPDSEAASCKIELYYAFKDRDIISPMGIMERTYGSIDLFKQRMYADFASLEYPL